MPISDNYKARLYPRLETIAEHFGTPFHIYDERGIRETVLNLQSKFDYATFQEYYAVKALPNPQILKILYGEGLGFDCSSIPELILARQTGASGERIFFTSNNTTPEEFEVALADGGCILNLDDISLIDKMPKMPELICFRYNPGEKRKGNSIIGNPVESKFGLAHDQLEEAYRLAKEKGANRFGIHAMIVSNERDYQAFVQTCFMLLELVEKLNKSLNIQIEFINLGGGLGIPYHPEDKPLDLSTLAAAIQRSLIYFERLNKYMPRIYMESARYITGSHGVLVTRAINHKDTYRRYIGVDANMSSLMRPGLYGAYHHIDVFGKDSSERDVIVDVVGALCENNDKFAVQRALPPIDDGDLLIIHDTGAHGHAMGFNYNGRLRPQELLLRNNGTVERIRRAETIEDYFATLNFEPKMLNISTTHTT
ncbi:MAG: diaminopimelate decarboxylase [Anaerolineae bacterium]|nr:diaminopimelate decarboxylase [Anaerolineae bacterium]